MEISSGGGWFVDYLRRIFVVRQKHCQAAVILAAVLLNVAGFLLVRVAFTWPPPPTQSSSSIITGVDQVVSFNYQIEPQHDNSPRVKVVLLWTPWFGDVNWTELFQFNNGPVISLNDGTNRKCLLTVDRHFVKEADALLFHGRDVEEKDLPSQLNHQRPKNQRWIFFSLEPPTMTFTEPTWVMFANVSRLFNWTISYSAKASVRYPYGRVLPKMVPSDTNSEVTRNKIAEFVRNFSKRPKDAIWIVSHCDTISRREQIVAKMKELGLSVDIFGKCSGIEAPNWNPDDAFFANYRYYLSLENSLCDDYVTEKFFRGLNLSAHFGVIPVGYHGDLDYAKLGVSGDMFINVRDYLQPNNNNITGLVHYLKKNLQNDRQLLASYYAWHFHSEVAPPQFANKWRNFCSQLWQARADDPQTVVDNVRDTYGKCVEPSFTT